MIWRWLARPLLFRLPPEWIHHLSMNAFAAASGIPGAARLIGGRPVVDPRLAVEAFGLRFPNCIGLAAGFDKSARWFPALFRLGFGHIEIGTVTARPQPGNPRPRLFRLTADRALLNRMGFNNPGAAAVAERLVSMPHPGILGINLGKSKVVDLAAAADDYAASFERLAPHADYIALNVSSPNTPGLRRLQERGPLAELLGRLNELNRRRAEGEGSSPRPILLKIAPDLNEHELEDVVEIALSFQLSGLIATNTTLERRGLRTAARRVERLGAGGISGGPLTARSREVVAYLARRTGGRLPLIGGGGILSGEDAWRMIGAGASLVQVYTGLVYGGPRFVHQLARDLAARLGAAGLASIAEARGRDLA